MRAGSRSILVTVESLDPPNTGCLQVDPLGGWEPVSQVTELGAGRFSPDLLGLQASSALAWLTLEVLAILLSLYLVTVNTDLTTIDLVAFLGYKYVG